MANHGVYVSQQTTSAKTPATAQSGVPFVIGLAPVQSAAAPAPVGIPVLCTSWAEAVQKLGYSDDWKEYTLCEVMYAHFKLFGCQPVIFCNLLDTAGMKEPVSAADMDVADHKVKLPIAALDDDKLSIKASGETGTAYAKNSDYSTYYDGEHLIIELMTDGACYAASKLSVSYNKVTTASVTSAVVASGMEAIEQCMTTFGVVPDLICAPKFSSDPIVAAIMATKAGGINGMFRAKALIDIDCGASGAKTYADAIAAKKLHNFVDADEILCWPMPKLGAYQFHMSTQIAGLMAQVDTANGGCPYESPSNKGIQCDALVLEDGTPVSMTLAQANMLGANGIVTALNFMGGWTCWGNYTACYPQNTDVKDYFIPVSRMFGWIGNTLIRTFWNTLDKPMNRRLIDTVMDSANIWLNGLVGSGYLLGARVSMLAEENSDTSLMAGIIKFHVSITPPAPAQEVDFVLEYDASYVAGALAS